MQLLLIALCGVVPTGIMMGTYHDEYRQQRYKETHMFQGTVMSSFDKHYLQRHGWTLLKHENCNGSYVNDGEYFTGDRSYAYLDAGNRDGEMIYQAEKRMPVEPGTYRISCHARAQWDGVWIYATTPSSADKPLAQTRVPAFGNKGGEIWEQARNLLDSEDKVTPSELQRARNILAVNDGEGYGWSKVEVTVQIAQKDTLCYGVSTDPEFTGDTSHPEWFSACDFRVESVDKDDNQKK